MTRTARTSRRKASESDSDGLDRTALDPALPTPLYHQIYLLVRERIRSGQFPTDAVLPGEQELSLRFGVSRITIKRALNELAAQGLVSRHRGRGTVVQHAPPSPMVKGSFDGLLSSLREMGLKTDVELLDLKVVQAPVWVAGPLELEPKAKVRHAIRLRRLEGEPFSYLLTWVPEEIGKAWTADGLRRNAMLTLLEQSGIVVTGAHQTITAVHADPALASALGIDVGAALLKIVRVLRDQHDRPVQLIHAFYRPERYQYEMTLTREGTGARWSDSD